MATLRIEATINMADCRVTAHGQIVRTTKGTEFHVDDIAQFFIRHADSMSITYENDLEPFDEIGAQP